MSSIVEEGVAEPSEYKAYPIKQDSVEETLKKWDQGRTGNKFRLNNSYEDGIENTKTFYPVYDAHKNNKGLQKQPILQSLPYLPASISEKMKEGTVKKSTTS